MCGELVCENLALKMSQFQCPDSLDLSKIFSWSCYLNYFIIYIILLIVFYSSAVSLMASSVFRPLFMNGCFNVVFALWFVSLFIYYFLGFFI